MKIALHQSNFEFITRNNYYCVWKLILIKSFLNENYFGTINQCKSWGLKNIFKKIIKLLNVFLFFCLCVSQLYWNKNKINIRYYLIIYIHTQNCNYWLLRIEENMLNILLTPIQIKTVCEQKLREKIKQT